MCDDWKNDYQSFKSWALSAVYDELKDRKLQTLDREDNNGNYEPNNCRWVSQSIQNKNKRFLGHNVDKGYKHNWTFEGVTKSAIEWCNLFNVSVPMVMYRVNVKHMEPFIALITPVSRRMNVEEITPQDVLRLREQGLTYQQIAEKLGCSLNTVKRRIGKIA